MSDFTALFYTKLAETLKQFPKTESKFHKPQRYWIGFSGGLDSHVLLHALSQLRIELQLEADLVALHIDHSINPASSHWQQHCQQAAKSLSVEFQSIKVDANHPEGESPEAWARNKRYEAFASVITKGDVLLLAHHQNDQAETLLLQLLRGAGPRGLAAMPSLCEFSSGWIARPLLETPRKALHEYAVQHQLHWIDDPSNQDHKYARNYLRHEVIPLLENKWPSYSRSLTRSASLQADAASLLDELASEDLKQLKSKMDDSLSISKALELNDNRLRNLLRYWIRQSGFIAPSAIKLKTIISDILHARSDRVPCVSWAGAEVRRYLGRLYLMSPLPEHDPTISYIWDLSKPLKLSIGTLTAKQTYGRGLSKALVDPQPVKVRFRTGGELFNKTGNQHRTCLKKFFQEQQIPTWQRDRLPLIYINEQIVAVSELCIANGYSVSKEQEGWVIHWAPDSGGT